jgi:hypothetical protein
MFRVYLMTPSQQNSLSSVECEDAWKFDGCLKNEPGMLPWTQRRELGEKNQINGEEHF